MAHQPTLPDMESLPERLAWAMKRAGLKNPEVAEVAGTTAETVSRWRGGGSEPERFRLEPIAALLRSKGVPVTVEWLSPSRYARETTRLRSYFGAASTELTIEERSVLARLRLEFTEMGCSEPEIAAGLELIAAPQAVSFVGTAHPPKEGTNGDRTLAIELMAPVVRTELAERRARAARAAAPDLDLRTPKNVSPAVVPPAPRGRAAKKRRKSK